MALRTRSKRNALALGLLGLAACSAPSTEPGGAEMLAAILSDPGLAQRADVASAPEGHFDTLREAYDTDFDHELSRAELATRDFRRFDRDGNGKVTLADFPGESGELEARVARSLDASLARSAIRLVFGADWQPRFRSLDTDANMRITRVEFEVAAPAEGADRRDTFAALLATANSWSDDELDWAELDALVH